MLKGALTGGCGASRETREGRKKERVSRVVWQTPMKTLYNAHFAGLGLICSVLLFDSVASLIRWLNFIFNWTPSYLVESMNASHSSNLLTFSYDYFSANGIALSLPTETTHNP